MPESAPDTALSQRPIGSTVRLTDQERAEAADLIENGDSDLIADEVILALLGEIRELHADRHTAGRAVDTLVRVADRLGVMVTKVVALIGADPEDADMTPTHVDRVIAEHLALRDKLAAIRTLASQWAAQPPTTPDHEQQIDDGCALLRLIDGRTLPEENHA